MSEARKHSEHQPSFFTTDDFVVPEATDEDWAAIEAALDTEHYKSAVFVTTANQQELFGGKLPTGPSVGPFALRAFAMHLIQPTKGGIGLETIISPTNKPGADATRFLKLCVNFIGPLVPAGNFPFRPVSISRTLRQMGLKVAAGITISTDLDESNKGLVSLVFPRIYLDQFRPDTAGSREDFATKLAAQTFDFLSLEYLKSVEPNGEQSSAEEN